jgi:hypothetical protein
MEAERGTPPFYVGQSQLLHYWPQLLLLLAAVAFALGSLPGAAVFGVPALIAGLALPWRFAVYSDGVDLWFSFGKRRALARDRVTVRADRGGVVVLPRGAQRMGYPLTSGFVDRDRLLVRDVFRFCGFDVVG